MRLRAAGEVRAVTRRDGTSKAGNDYTMHTVRLLTPDIDVSEVVIFGDQVRIPTEGEHVAYDVECEVRGGRLNVQAVRETPTNPLTVEQLAAAGAGVADKTDDKAQPVKAAATVGK